MYFMEGAPKKPETTEPEPVEQPTNRRADNVYDNKSYIPDTVSMQHISGRTSDKNYY